MRAGDLGYECIMQDCPHRVVADKLETSSSPESNVNLVRAFNLTASAHGGISTTLTPTDNPIAFMDKFYWDPEKARPYPFVKTRGFRVGFESLAAHEQSWYDPVQIIVFEFDYTPLTEQVMRIDRMAKVLHTPLLATYSGNKSIHAQVFVKPFAKNSQDYTDGCFGLLAYLAEEMPNDFYYAEALSDVPIEKRSLFPDPAMFSGNSRYTRQPWGTNANGNRQSCKVIWPKETELLDIRPLIIPKGQL